MFFVGLILIAAAVFGFVLAKPRNGFVKVAAVGSLGDVVALAITITGAVGVVTMLIGLGRL